MQIQRMNQLKKRMIFMKADWPGMFLCITFEKPIDFGGFFRMDMIGFSNYSVSDSSSIRNRRILWFLRCFTFRMSNKNLRWHYSRRNFTSVVKCVSISFYAVFKYTNHHKRLSSSFWVVSLVSVVNPGSNLHHIIEYAMFEKTHTMMGLLRWSGLY